MMPDLGRFEVAVLGSYAAGMLILAAIIGLSVWQSRRTLRALREVEARKGREDA
jgi:heme exporter protein D